MLRLFAKMRNNLIDGLVVLPGLFLQRMTVKEPDDSQIEVAIAANNEVLKLRKSEKGACKQC